MGHIWEFYGEIMNSDKIVELFFLSESDIFKAWVICDIIKAVWEIASWTTWDFVELSS